MRKYELLLTLPGTLDENEVTVELEKVTTVLKEFLEDIKVNEMGKIRLAYPVRQIRYGYLYTITFESDPANIAKINQKLRLNKTILRAIISLENPRAGKIKPVVRREVKAEEVKKEEVVSQTVPVATEPVKEDVKEEVVEAIEAKPEEKTEAVSERVEKVAEKDEILKQVQDDSMEEKKDEIKEELKKKEKPASDSNVDLNEIDKKLDEILGGTDII